MKNKLGKDIKIYNAKETDFSLKYNWTYAAKKLEKDAQRCRDFYEHPFADIPPKPGIYLFCFPDDGFYIGQSENLSARFNAHFYNFFSPKCNDWHKTFGLRSWIDAKRYIKDYCTYCYMIVEKDKLDLYEQSALAQIISNDMADRYYNTIFYKQEEDKND